MTRREINRQFYLIAKDEEVTPKLRLQVAEIAGLSEISFLGAYAEELTSRVVLPEDPTHRGKIRDILLHRPNWSAHSTGGNSETIVDIYQKPEDQKIYLRNAEGEWVMDRTPSFNVALVAEDMEDHVRRIGTAATVHEIRDYMAAFYINLRTTRPD
jgi:hypothetical protein